MGIRPTTHEANALEAEVGDILLREQIGGSGDHRSARGGDRPHVCFLLDGSFTEHRGSKSVTRTRGGVRVSPEGDAHRVEFGSGGARCLMISAPERLRPPDGPRFVRSSSLGALCRSVRIPTLDEVASVADRHPTHVARTFRETYGCTVGHYARRLRLRKTVDLIRGTEQSLAQVAYAMGFTDQSHMTRAVRAGLGHTPGELRRIAVD